MDSNHQYGLPHHPLRGSPYLWLMPSRASIYWLQFIRLRGRRVRERSAGRQSPDEAGGKQPHLFTAADGSPILALAGLWDRWIDPASREETLSWNAFRPAPESGPSPDATE